MFYTFEIITHLKAKKVNQSCRGFLNLRFKFNRHVGRTHIKFNFNFLSV